MTLILIGLKNMRVVGTNLSGL